MEKEMTVRELASIGGHSRARKLSKERLSQIGRKAVRARWAKYYAKQQNNERNKQWKKTLRAKKSE
jgi:hypothetical protein